MTKLELTALIMANTDKYLKTHLMTKHIADLKEIAAPYLVQEKIVNKTAETPVTKPETSVNEIITDNAKTDIQPSNLQNESEKTKLKKERLNDTEKLMLETIPQLSEFKDINSSISGKAFLAKVEELHGVAIVTSRALMVALKKKAYIRIVGKKSGQKHTTVQLLPLGIEYLGFTVSA